MTPRIPERQRAAAARLRVAAATGMRPGLMNKMVDAQRRERDLILSEFVKAKGLMPLLMKRRNGGSWSRTERVELHERLRALANISPYLFVLILPGSFAFLPMLAWWLDRRRHRRDDDDGGRATPH
jgi:hypothetical protein